MTSFSPVNAYNNIGHFIHKHPEKVLQASLATILGISFIALGILGNYCPAIYATGVLPGADERVWITIGACSVGVMWLTVSFLILRF